MAIQCPECDSRVSDRSLYCPRCGKPLPTKTASQPRTKKTRKRIRLPNGFGQISEIKNQNLRKPFRAMVTVGVDELGKPICKPLKPTAYFSTYNEAYSALVAHQTGSYTLNTDVAMNDLFKLWFAEYSKDKADKTLDGVQSAWKWAEPLYDMKVNEVRVRHIKDCLDAVSAGSNTAGRVKQILNMMFDYALIYELTDQNYSRMYIRSYLKSGEDDAPKKPHITYSAEEIELLWKIEGNSIIADMILVQCYSGWRPGEMFTLRLENVDLESQMIMGGSKTQAGKNRIVPIHSKIEHIIRRHYTQSSGKNSAYLFPGNYGHQMDYHKYLYEFNKLMSALSMNPEHRPHDGRVCFVTRAKNANINEFALKLIIGHKIKDITEHVYTKRNPLWLKEEIEKIK